MKYLINLILLGLIGLFAYMLYHSINEPIKFEAFKIKRSAKVVNNLMQIRESQRLYKEIKGQYAPSFDTLIYVLKNDSIPNEIIEGDPDDPDNLAKVKRTMVYYSAIDSIRNMGIDLDKIRYIPYTDNKDFMIKADTIEYQSTTVPVVEVGASWGSFMGQYADIKYSKYDQNYDPNNLLKFGDMSKPVDSGNWE